MDYNLLDALELLEREKGVPAEVILDALANALVSAYKRTPGQPRKLGSRSMSTPARSSSTARSWTRTGTSPPNGRTPRTTSAGSRRKLPNR